MNTIIEKIRAEVLRLIRESEGPGSPYGFGKMSAYNRILNILDTLQEQPVCEESIVQVSLQSATDPQLIDELRRRGFTGTITKNTYVL